MATITVPLTNSVTLTNDRYFANHPTLKIIERCSNSRQLKQIHAQMLRVGLFHDPFSASKLIQATALSHFSSLEYALLVFGQIPHPNLYSWNALVRAFASSDKPICALSMFVRLLYECDEFPNKFTYPFVIKACAKIADFGFGKGVHGMVVKNGYGSDLFVGNCLIHFYSECGCIDLACRVFLNMRERDVVSWNSMINCFAQNGCVDEAVEFFYRMEGEGLRPNDVTMVGVLSACGKKMDLELARRMHSYVEGNGIFRTMILENAVLDMYTKCGGMEDARKFFDEMGDKDVISWTTMLAGYAKMGDFDAAKELFELSPSKDIAMWNALISAYEQSGNPKEAIAVFDELQHSKSAKPDEVTLVSTLSACSQLGAMELGCWIHVYIKKERILLNRYLVTALIDMYSKCGDLEKAIEVFESFEKRDVFVWSAMIAGFSMHGKGKEAIELFSKMQEADVKPSSVTFTNLLAACSHSGLVEEGKTLFAQMEQAYKIKPCVEHYSCMVDILGRAGHLDDAIILINSMPMSPSASVWGALLGACKLHKNVDLAKHAFNELTKLEPQNHGAYVLLSNTYANLGKWEMVAELRKHMRDGGLKKEPGCSSIEVDGNVHEFLVGHTTHPMSKKIYSKLEEVAAKLKSVGYVSNKSEVLQCVEEEDMQEKALHLHSERLAIAFGLISLGTSQPIRVVKNLRVCEDCHSVAKLVSQIYDTEILLRDRYRYHHFREGRCSCMDYW